MRRSTFRHSQLPGVTTAFKTPVRIPPYIGSSMVPPRAHMSTEQATRQMADDMREAAYREGGLTREGLELLGYTPLQIDSLATAARARANRLAALT